MQLFSGCIGKAQHQFIEVFIKLFAVVEGDLIVVEDGYAVALLGGRRRKVKVAFALEDRAGHLAVYRATKSDAALAKHKGSRVTAQLQVIDRDHIATRQQT